MEWNNNLLLKKNTNIINDSWNRSSKIYDVAYPSWQLPSYLNSLLTFEK